MIKNLKYETKKFILITLVLVIANVILFYILTGVVREQSLKYEEQREITKGKFVLIEKNALGCTHYTYNEDHVWKCPDDLHISTVERVVCGHGKHRQVCNTVYDPVIK